MPTNKEIILPEERPEREEAGIRAFGTEMLEVTKKYIKEKVDKTGYPRERNLTVAQEVGLKEIQSLIGRKHVVTKTDKSDRLCLLTEEDYVETGQPHVEGDDVKENAEYIARLFRGLQKANNLVFGNAGERSSRNLDAKLARIPRARR